MRLTRKQTDIVALMQNGYVFITGLSETTNKPIYMVSKGYDNVYLKADTFTRLLQDGILRQESSFPFDYVLTKKALELKIKY